MALLQDYRLADPKYTAFIPKNAGHAILKFRRLQEKGLAPWKYPETMIDLCKELSDDESSPGSSAHRATRPRPTRRL